MEAVLWQFVQLVLWCSVSGGNPGCTYRGIPQPTLSTPCDPGSQSGRPGSLPDPSPYGPPVGGPEPRRPSHYTLGTRTPELALPLGLDQLPGTVLPSPLPTTGPPPSQATHHGTTTVTVSRCHQWPGEKSKSNDEGAY
ncbi:unnamed protein product [Gadus morhua 'NCC']